MVHLPPTATVLRQGESLLMKASLPLQPLSWGCGAQGDTYPDIIILCQIGGAAAMAGRRGGDKFFSVPQNLQLWPRDSTRLHSGSKSYVASRGGRVTDHDVATSEQEGIIPS